MKHAAMIFVYLLGALAFAACSLPAGTGQGSALVTGTVTYRERIAVPTDAVVTVSLEDVSKMDVPSTLVAETRFRANGGPPYAFALGYDPADIHNGRRYSLRATIRLGERLLFTSTEHIPPFEQENVEILVRKTGGRGTNG